jgi:hypothetical protein
MYKSIIFADAKTEASQAEKGETNTIINPIASAIFESGIAKRLATREIIDTFLNIIAVIGNVPNWADKVPAKSIIAALNALAKIFLSLRAEYHFTEFNHLSKTG